MPNVICKTSSLEEITTNIYRVRLIPKSDFSFRAGQYLILKITDQERRAFSVASTPIEQDIIELHIGASEYNSYAMSAIMHIQNNTNIIIDIPHGHAWLREEKDFPIILIAGGTGFSYIRSILLTALAEQADRSISLYWGGREKKHLYELDALNLLTLRYPNLNVHPVLEYPIDGFKGRYGTVLNAVMDDYGCLSKHYIYLAGPVSMVRKARVFFCAERDAQPSLMFADAFNIT
ncbi:NAD(P)H-flavin reductase [Candidatus Erwinia haradaeae]|uniref:NAD(P)H-flavin reductase n=1 Tax=Candidatus Erwinia haradaeae TaxID=1922217 RepID=A0A451DCW4_9GAMM|nr:NAD(P)H-flavin reductase [Candidatus Erwinia haradaeae]VFP84233.1 NAD(P)H-flavin reductase [Candidatus Erwinia haradaeae]